MSLPFDVIVAAVVPLRADALSVVEGQLVRGRPDQDADVHVRLRSAELARPPAGDPRLSQTQEGVVCRVSRVVTAEDHWSVEVTLDYPEGNVKLDSYQSWVVNNEMVLEARRRTLRQFLVPAGRVHAAARRPDVQLQRSGEDETRARGLEARLPDARALVVKVPITFSFQDVPLP